MASQAGGQAQLLLLLPQNGVLDSATGGAPQALKKIVVAYRKKIITRKEQVIYKPLVQSCGVHRSATALWPYICCSTEHHTPYTCTCCCQRFKNKLSCYSRVFSQGKMNVCSHRACSCRRMQIGPSIIHAIMKLCLRLSSVIVVGFIDWKYMHSVGSLVLPQNCMYIILLLKFTLIQQMLKTTLDINSSLLCYYA